MAEPEIKKPVKKPEDKPDIPPEEDVDDIDDMLAEAAEEADKAEKKFVEIVPQTSDELMRMSSLQDTLTSFMPGIRDFKPKSETPEGREEEFKTFKEKLQKDQEEIKKEKERGVFGPATNKAFQEYKDWLEAKAVPSALISLDCMQLPIPDGCPLKLPMDKNQRAINPELFKAITAGGDQRLDLGINAGKIPTDEDLQKLDSTLGWVERSTQRIQTEKEKLQDEGLKKIIELNGLPKGWLEGRDKDPAAWRSSASDMIDLSLRTRNYVEAMQALFKDTQNRWGDFPVKFPPGTKVTVDYRGQEKVLTDAELNDPNERYILKNSTIKNVSLDLPEDLRQDHPANAQKIERLRQWLKDNGEQVDQAVLAYSKALDNPDGILMFGDREFPEGWRAKLNAKGEMTAMVSPNYLAKPGDNLQPANLLGCDASVSRDKDGNYIFTQTVRAENAPPWAYLNMRFLGVQRVGEPMAIDSSKPYKPDDFVPVRDGEKISLIQAKNVEAFLNNQRLFYYGEKGLTLAMDGAMLVSGTIEVGAAIKAGRLAAAAAGQGLKLAAKDAAIGLTKAEVRWEAAKAFTRVGVAGAGIFNNAGARATDWGQTVNTARGLYFLGDISQGLVRGGWRMAAGARAAENMTSAEKVHRYIHEAMSKGLKGTKEGQEAAETVIKATPWVSKLHTGTSYTFKATEYGFAPIIASELNHQIGDLMGKHHNNLRDATILIGDGRGTQTAKKGAFDMNDPEALKGAHQLIDGYSATLKDGRPKETQDQIQAIFDKTKSLLDPKATEDQRKAYREELLGKLAFTGADIRKLEELHPDASEDPKFRLSEQQIHDLLDPEKRAKMPKALREEAEKILQAKDKDVDSAARVALLYLSRDADGNINKDLANKSVDVEPYERTIVVPPEGESSGYTYKVKIEGRSVAQSLSLDEGVRHLQRDLESTDKGNRGIVTGDALLRVGGLTPRQYAGVLQDVLNDPKASKADKMRALCDPQSARFASIVDGVKKFDAASPPANADEKAEMLGRGFGLSPESLMRTLETRAKSDSDPDVRAMSAALLYGLKEKFAAEKAAEFAKNEKLVATQMAEKTRGQEKAEWVAAAAQAETVEKAAREAVKKSAAVLSDLNGVWQASQGQPPGTFAKKVIEHLNSETEKPIARAADEYLARQTKINAALALAMLTDKSDAAAQLNITRTIASAYDPKDPRLTEQVINAMLPDRMKELSQADPTSANELRQKLIEGIKVPLLQEHVSVVANLMEAAKPLILDSFQEKDKVLRQNFSNELAQKYRDLLDPGLFKTYAAYAPELRASALLGLAQLGCADDASIALMRRHVSEQPKIKLGGKEIDALETDARVRAAAVHALKTVNDKAFRETVLELIDKETDPRVAQMLRDTKFSYQRPDRDSRDYKDLYENIRKLVEDPGKFKKYPYLKAWDDTAKPPTRDSSADFLDINFNLLNRSEMATAVSAAANKKIDEMGTWDWFWSGKKYLAGEELKAVKEVEAQRMEQFKSLCELAQRGDENGNKAKLALAYLATKGPEHTGRATDEVEYAGRYFKRGNEAFVTRSNPDFQKLAADALADCCKTGVQGRDLVADKIRTMLEHGYNLRSDVLSSLLKGWKDLAKPSTEGKEEIAELKKLDPNYQPKQYAMSREVYAATIANALTTELAKPPASQSQEFQKTLLEQLKEFKHRGALHILEAMGGSQFAEVKKAADQLLFELRDSVNMTWSETAPLNFSQEERAARLKAALGDPKTRDGVSSEKTAESTVQEIFSAYKGYDLKPGDKGLPYLEMAMKEQNNRVRLAAAMVVMKSPLDSNDPTKRLAIETIAEIAIDNPTSGFGKDAAELLGPQKTAANINPLATSFAKIALEGGERGKRAMKELDGLLKNTPETVELDNGVQVRARKTINGVIVEELKQGKVERVVLPEGKTRAQFLLNDARTPSHPPDERYQWARQILKESQKVNASAEDKTAAVRVITNLLDHPSFDEKLKMEAAKMVAVQPGLSDEDGKRARELAFNAMAELAAHGTNTKAEALAICTGDPTAAAIARNYTLKTLQAAVERKLDSAEKQVQEKLNFLLALSDPKDEKSTMALMDAATYAAKILPQDHPALAAVTSKLGLGVDAPPIQSKNDARLPALMRALNSENPQLQQSAAWVLADRNIPANTFDARTREHIANAMRAYRQDLSSRAVALEKGGRTQEASAAWAKVEAAFKHSGEPPESFGYTYATMKRMECTTGAASQDLAPIYDRLAKIAQSNNNAQQVDYFNQKARFARGEAASVDIPVANSPVANNFGPGGGFGGNGGGFGQGDGGAELGAADSDASSFVNKDIADVQEAALLKTVQEQEKGGMSPALAQAQQKLGEFYISNIANRNLVKAKELLGKSLQGMEQTNGRDQEWAATRARLAFCDARTGDYEGSNMGYAEALGAMMQPGNQQSPEFMNLYNTLQQQVQLHGKPGEFDMLRDNPAAYFQIQKVKSQSKLAGVKAGNAD